jgi:hypothetical protein
MPTSVTEIIDEKWEATLDSDELMDPEELTYPERVDYRRAQIPDGYDHIYETLVGRGCTTRVAAAVCRYLAGRDGSAPPWSQTEVATEFDVSPTSIQRWAREFSSPDGS